MANCPHCGTPLSRHEQFAGTICGNWRCREKFLETQLVAHRTQAAETLGIANPESFPIAVVPHWTPGLEALELEHRQTLAEFLHGLIASQSIGEIADTVMVAPAQPDSPAMSAQLGRVCAVCRGYCCLHGAANNAFLDHKTLLRFMSDKPELELSDVVSLYLDYLPDQHCQNACIYQGEQGCTLPREMRADICNSYECGGLRAARERFLATSSNRGFVVVRHDHKIRRSAFINDSVILHYPVKETDP